MCRGEGTPTMTKVWKH